VGCDAALSAARAGELVLLAEALIESEGKTSVAAKKLGLSRSSFYWKLRRLGLPLRQLKARLNVIRHGRAARSISDAKARW
jgi:DNA-binding NtrC family response regulator